MTLNMRNSFVFGLIMYSTVFSGTEIRDMIDACSQNSCTIELENKTYYETQPWNLRDKNHLTIRGHGNTVFFIFPLDNPPSVMIDATGARWLHFENWFASMRSYDGRPDVGLLLSRNASKGKSGDHHFERWRVGGWYKKATVYSLCSEINTWEHCGISNIHPNVVVFFTSRRNLLNVTSQFGPFFLSTNTATDFYNTSIANYGHGGGANPDGIGIWIDEGTRDFHIYGGSGSMNTEGRAFLRISGKNNNNIILNGVEWETKGADNCIWVEENAELYNFAVRDSLLQSKGSTVKIDGVMAWSTIGMNQYWNASDFDIEVTDNQRTVVSNMFHVRKRSNVSGSEDFWLKNKVTVWEELTSIDPSTFDFVSPSRNSVHHVMIHVRKD